MQDINKNDNLFSQKSFETPQNISVFNVSFKPELKEPSKNISPQRNLLDDIILGKTKNDNINIDNNIKNNNFNMKTNVDSFNQYNQNNPTQLN